MAWWAPFAAQAGANFLGNFFGNRSKDDAKEEYLAAMQAAAGKGKAAMQAAIKKVGTKVDKAADRAENRAKNQLQQFKNQAAAQAAETLSVSQAAATAERTQVIEDEATRFVRLREAAEAGGFNPLTVLASGFTGAALPTGVLSPDWHLGQGGMKMDALTAGHTTRMSLDGQVQGQRIQSVVDGYSLGLNAMSITQDHIMRGHEGAVQAGQAAYEQTANVWRDMGNIAVSAWDARTTQLTEQAAAARDQARIDLDRERLDLDREQYAYEQAYNERALASAGGRLPGYGDARVGSWASGGSLTDEPITLRYGTGNTTTMPGNVSTPADFNDAMGDMGGEAVATVTYTPEIIEGLEQGFRRWGTVIMDGIANRTTPAGQAWGEFTDRLAGSAAIRAQVHEDAGHGGWLNTRTHGPDGIYGNWGGTR